MESAPSERSDVSLIEIDSVVLWEIAAIARRPQSNGNRGKLFGYYNESTAAITAHYALPGAALKGDRRGRSDGEDELKARVDSFLPNYRTVGIYLIDAERQYFTNSLVETLRDADGLPLQSFLLHVSPEESDRPFACFVLSRHFLDSLSAPVAGDGPPMFVEVPLRVLESAAGGLLLERRPSAFSAAQLAAAVDRLEEQTAQTAAQLLRAAALAPSGDETAEINRRGALQRCRRLLADYRARLEIYKRAALSN